MLTKLKRGFVKLNGQPYQKRTFKFGDEITYTCKNGFTLSGPSKMVCSGIGKWKPWDQGKPSCSELRSLKLLCCDCIWVFFSEIEASKQVLFVNGSLGFVQLYSWVECDTRMNCEWGWSKAVAKLGDMSIVLVYMTLFSASLPGWLNMRVTSEQHVSRVAETGSVFCIPSTFARLSLQILPRASKTPKWLNWETLRGRVTRNNIARDFSPILVRPDVHTVIYRRKVSDKGRIWRQTQVPHLHISTRIFVWKEGWILYWTLRTEFCIDHIMKLAWLYAIALAKGAGVRAAEPPID